MDAPAQPIPISPAVTDCLVRIQQTLLAAKYAYAGGDPPSWPVSFVAMGKGRRMVLIGPWLGPRSGEIAEKWAAFRKQAPPGCGLILVGQNDPFDPHVRTWFETASGSIAYLAPHTRQFLLRGRGGTFAGAREPMRRADLKKFLDPAALGQAAQIDCHQRLVGDLAQAGQASRFVAASRAAAGIGRPMLSYALIAALVALFAAMIVSAQSLEPALETLIAWGALHGPLVRAGQYWRILTCASVHANPIHIFFNGYALLYFGNVLEVLQGRWRLGVFFIFAVATASLASLWWHPQVVSVGASGGLFGLVGAMGALILRHRKDFPPGMWRGLRKWVLTVLAYNLIWLLVPFVDNAAHVGGLAGGAAMGLMLTRSPVRRRGVGMAGLIGAAVLCAAVAAAGYWIVSHLPAGTTTVPSTP